MKKKNIIAVLAVVLIMLCAGLGYFIWKHAGKTPASVEPGNQETSQITQEETEADLPTEADTFETAPVFESGLVSTNDVILDQAGRQAGMYDYDGAIATIQAQAGYENKEAYTKAIADYEAAKGKLVKWSDNTKITHVFFHSLSVDVAKTFDTALCGESQVKAYNQVMTTVNEFVKIIQSMYDKGFVLVRLQDIAKMETKEDGSSQMIMQPILLPKGKQPFVLSVDDVSYYEYMKGQGFATRLVIDEDNKVTNEYQMEDGTVIRGSFDVLPILEDFIEAHPDFSYKGAKGILALTGYEGVFGYRTSDYWFNWNCDYFDASNAEQVAQREKYYYNNPNIEQDKQTAKKVAEAIKAQGWELASHSWGHRDMGEIEYSSFVWDTDMWEREVRPILGEIDTIIFPKGADIAGWRGYEADNERFQYLKSKGFNYFCNVDASVYWVQIGANKDYFRMGRRNLDGTRMWEAIQSYQVTDGSYKDRLSDLFDAKTVFDPARPTPVK